jgi:hypothetical protein
MGRGAYRVISSSRSASQWRTCGRSDPARILEADASETPSCRLIWGQADSFQGWLDLSRTDLPPQSWLTLSLGPRQCLSRKGPPQVKWGVSGVPKEFTQSALLEIHVPSLRAERASRMRSFVVWCGVACPV